MSQMNRERFKAQFVEEDLPSWTQTKSWPVYAGIKKDGECLRIIKRGDQILLDNMRKRQLGNEALKAIGHEKFLDALLAAIKVDGEFIGEGIVGDGGRHKGKSALSRYMSVIAHGEAEATQGPLRIMFHDVAEMNGQDTTHFPHQSRLSYLRSAIEPNDRVELEEGQLCRSMDDVKAFYEKTINRGFEGICVKANVPLTWASFLKMKPTHTLDAVIMAIEKTDGYKKNGISQSYVIGVWNSAQNEWVRIGEVGTGFSDTDLAQIMGTLKDKVMREDDHFIYVEPTMVVEVKYQEINFSDEATFHLRFPRLVRIRDDKAPTECLYRQILEQYKAQENHSTPEEPTKAEMQVVPEPTCQLNPPTQKPAGFKSKYDNDIIDPSPYKIRCRTCAGPVDDGKCLRCSKPAITNILPSEPIRPRPSVSTKPKVQIPKPTSEPIEDVPKTTLKPVLGNALIGDWWKAEYL